MARATEEMLSGIHEKFAELLNDIVRNGKVVEITDKETGEVRAARVTPDAATMNQIRQFLKDNHMETAPGKSKAINNLAANLPFAGTPEDLEDVA